MLFNSTLLCMSLSYFIVGIFLCRAVLHVYILFIKLSIPKLHNIFLSLSYFLSCKKIEVFFHFVS